MAGVLVLVAALSLGLALLSARAVENAVLQNAADAAALAAAHGSPGGNVDRRVARIAQANGARLESVRWRDGVVTVVVRRGSQHARAAARLVWQQD